MIEALRVLVADVDEALPAWQALGFAVTDRWGPPFAVLGGPGPDIWLSGPATSAAKITETLTPDKRDSATTRPVEVTQAFADRVAELELAGWKLISEPQTGPGGSQVLLAHAETILEVFQPG